METSRPLPLTACGESAPVAQRQASEESQRCVLSEAKRCQKQSMQNLRSEPTEAGLLCHSFPNSNRVSSMLPGAVLGVGASVNQADIISALEDLTNSCTP